MDDSKAFKGIVVNRALPSLHEIRAKTLLHFYTERYYLNNESLSRKCSAR